MTASNAELTLAAQLEQAGIPFEREFRFAPPRRWRADFLIADKDHWWEFMAGSPFHLLIEIDGGGYVAGRHSRGGGIEADAEKQSAAAILGYRVIRCTPKQVEDGRALEWIRQALGLERPEMVAAVEDQVRLLQEGVPNIHRRLSGETR